MTSTSSTVGVPLAFFFLALFSTALLHLQLNILFFHETWVLFFCGVLLNSFNTQVSGILFNCPLSLLLPGVRPWAHINHFAVEHHYWLLWGQHFTYLFPPWKENIKTHSLSEEFLCPGFTDAVLSSPDVTSLCRCFWYSRVCSAFLMSSFCVIVLSWKIQRIKE